MWSSRHSSDVRRQGKAPETSNFAHTCNRLSQYMKEKGSLRDLNLEIGGKVESVEALVKPRSFLAASPSTSKNLQTNSGKSAQPSSEKQCSVLTVEDASYKASTSFSTEATTRESKTAQLTIFYSGRVLIFDDYPADKVKELVSFAKKGSSQMSYGITLNAIQEKPKPIAPTSSAREGLPPRPHAGGGKQPIGISSKDKMSAANNGSGTSTSEAPEPLSPQSEANGSDLPIARRSSLHRFLEKRRDRAAVRGPYQHPEPPAPSSKDDQQLDLNILPQKD